MNYLNKLFTESLIRKIFAVLILIGFIILLAPFKNLLLLTFIFTFLLGKVQNLIYKKVNIKFKVDKKIIAIFIFITIIGGAIFSLYIYIPKLAKELIELKNQITLFVTNIENPIIIEYIEKMKNLNYSNYISSYKGNVIYFANMVKGITMSILMALILSLILVFEEKSLQDFGRKLSNSKIKFLYDFYKDLGGKFLGSFGMIIELQFVSSFVNGIMAVIGLLILGFPHVIGLGFLIFIASLIPIVGTIVAMIPICIIGLEIGGIGKVVAVIILVALINFIEGYITKPLLMNKSVKIPTFLIFLSLIIGEHFMGTWGLLLGLPLMMFIFEILDIR